MGAGEQINFHSPCLLIPEELAVQRVLVRVETGGHPVPEEKIRGHFHRLWKLVREASTLVDEAEFRDNSRDEPPFDWLLDLREGTWLGQQIGLSGHLQSCDSC